MIRWTDLGSVLLRAAQSNPLTDGEDYWLPRGIDPSSGKAAEPDEETREGLRLLEAARARARSRGASSAAAGRARDGAT